MAICGFYVLAFLFSLYLSFRTYELWGVLRFFFLETVANSRIYSSVSDYGYRPAPLAREVFFFDGLQVGVKSLLLRPPELVSKKDRDYDRIETVKH